MQEGQDIQVKDEDSDEEVQESSQVKETPGGGEDDLNQFME
jgi:hypothetical protein